MAAIFLILGYNTGLYIAAIAIIVLFAFLISGAWLLMLGIYEDQEMAAIVTIDSNAINANLVTQQPEQ